MMRSFLIRKINYDFVVNRNNFVNMNDRPLAIADCIPGRWQGYSRDIDAL